MEIGTLIAQFDCMLAQEQLQDMMSLNAAGEPGIALENLCTQLYEFDIPVEETELSKIRQLCLAMGVSQKYWQRLSKS